MGLADMLKEEATLEITTSEYRELIEAKTMADIMKRAREKRVPESYVSMMLDDSVVDVNEYKELEAYRATGITPDRFKVIDEEYRKLSRKSAGLADEVVRLTEEKAKLFDQVKELEKRCRGLEESSDNYRLGCGKKQGQIDAMGAQIAELREAIQERNTQIEDLKKKLAEKEAYIDRILWGIANGVKVENDGE